MTDEAPPPPRVPVARIFTHIVGDKGEKQFFDVPLKVANPGMTAWQTFMMSLLGNRGMLVDNAWIPERSILWIALNPETGGLDPEKVDTDKVTMLRPIA